MKEYYYLNAQREPQGPHALHELSGMMASGRINPTTLVACKGGSSWEPLGVVLSQETGENICIPPIPREVGHCPSCQRDLTSDLVEGQLPTQCPGCTRYLKPTSNGIWNNFRNALRLYATFSGRATRAEYWSFVLVNTLIVLAFYAAIIITAILAAVELKELGFLQQLEESDVSNAHEVATRIAESLRSSGSIYLILSLLSVLCLIGWWFYIIIPAFAVMVRRLHDVGWSGWWVLVQQLLSFIPFLLLMGMTAYLGFVEELSDSQLATLAGMEFASSLINLASTGLAILLFILTLLDSNRGANKYGPSSKYPRG